MKIIQIAPALAPSINGVGDYVRLLARQLHQDYGIETHFVVGDPAWDGPTEVVGFPVMRIAARTGHAIAAALQDTGASTILLHYVGYGYARRGCPIWLVDGIERWLKDYGHRRLVTMFHELYATGPLWTSAFWLSRLQRHLALRMGRMSNRILTSTETFATRLYNSGLPHDKTIETLPIFSNMGEPRQILPLCERAGRLILFGHPGARAAIYGAHRELLNQVCRMFGIDEICEVGLPTGVTPPQFPGVKVLQRGVLDASAISALLQDSRVGFLAFPPPAYLAKSGVFAAYCAHGMLTVHTDDGATATDGLISDRHYWAAGDNKVASYENAQQIADSAYTWYHEHRLSTQSKLFAKVLSAHPGGYAS